jgi:hypothetical protein
MKVQATNPNILQRNLKIQKTRSLSNQDLRKKKKRKGYEEEGKVLIENYFMN